MSCLTLVRRAAVLAAIAAAAAPAALRAQTSTPAKVFYACYVPTSGTVYRIKETDLQQECDKSTHVQVSWTDGAARPVTTVLGEIRTVSANGNGEAIATCPAGWYVVGGSYQLITFSDAAQPVIRFSGPLLDPANTSWVVSVHNSVPNPIAVKTRAIARCTQ